MRINEISLTREFNILNSELATILTTLKGSKDLLTIRKCNFEYELMRDKGDKLYYMLRFMEFGESEIDKIIISCFNTNTSLHAQIKAQFIESRSNICNIAV